RSSSLKRDRLGSRPLFADQTGGRDRTEACPGLRGAAIWSPGRSPSCARETLSRVSGEHDERAVEGVPGALATGPRSVVSRLSSFMTLLLCAPRRTPWPMSRRDEYVRSSSVLRAPSFDPRRPWWNSPGRYTRDTRRGRYGNWTSG